MPENIFAQGNSVVARDGTLKLCRLLDKGGVKVADSKLALAKRVGRR